MTHHKKAYWMYFVFKSPQGWASTKFLSSARVFFGVKSRTVLLISWSLAGPPWFALTVGWLFCLFQFVTENSSWIFSSERMIYMNNYFRSISHNDNVNYLQCYQMWSRRIIKQCTFSTTHCPLQTRGNLSQAKVTDEDRNICCGFNELISILLKELGIRPGKSLWKFTFLDASASQ